MVYLVAAAAVVLAVELFIRFALMSMVSEMSETLRKARWVVSSRLISDHWKEKVLLRYSGRLAGVTIKIAAVIGVVALSVIAISALAERVISMPVSVLGFLASWQGVVSATVVSVGYVLFRSRFVAR